MIYDYLAYLLTKAKATSCSIDRIIKNVALDTLVQMCSIGFCC